MNNFWKEKKVLVTGGAGFLGKHVVDLLRKNGVAKLLTPRSSDYDLLLFENCMKVTKNIDVVIHLAAKVGGLDYNLKKSGEIFYQNTLMDLQMMEASRQNNVSKFVGISSVSSYSKNANIPLTEEDLWNGYPEESKAFYGMSKRNVVVQSRAYRQQYDFNSIVLLPVNLYGPGDKFEENQAHVIPSLIKRFYEAKNANLPEVVCRATGKTTREFLYVEDAARGIILATEKYNKSDPVNLGSPFEIVIEELTLKIAKIIGYSGKIKFVDMGGGGQIRRNTNSNKALKEFGFKAKINFDEGLKRTISWFNEKIVS